MLRYAVIAVVGALSAAGAAQAVAALSERPAPVPAAEVVLEAPAAAGAAPAQIAKAADGHFWAEANVNGRRVRFLVDTGATAVALTPADAQRLGFDPRELTYDYTVNTANGRARAASVLLASVAVSGARVNDVEALVIEDGLDTSLLGMTYLGRLNRFEASRNALILRP